MEIYSQLATALIVSILIPAVYVTRSVWPKRFIWIFRGGEVAVALALTLGATLRLVLILSVHDIIVYPGTFWAITTLMVLSIMSSLLWGRVSQLVRHSRGNKQNAEMGVEQLRAMGIDVDQIKKSANKSGEQKP